MTWEPTTKPVIVCAANRMEDDVLLVGPRHWDLTMHSQLEAMSRHGKQQHGLVEQGFIDQFGRFYTREEAMLVARQNNQIIVKDEDMLSLVALHSEDLY